MRGCRMLPRTRGPMGMGTIPLSERLLRLIGQIRTFRFLTPSIVGYSRPYHALPMRAYYLGGMHSRDLPNAPALRQRLGLFFPIPSLAPVPWRTASPRIKHARAITIAYARCLGWYTVPPHTTALGVAANDRRRFGFMVYTAPQLEAKRCVATLRWSLWW